MGLTLLGLLLGSRGPALASSHFPPRRRVPLPCYSSFPSAFFSIALFRPQFLACVDTLGGLTVSTPSDILKLMDMPELTRHHVASHLQKHRMNILLRAMCADPNDLEMGKGDTDYVAAVRAQPITPYKPRGSWATVPR